jgi:two-component system NtrC family sensor kinase
MKILTRKLSHKMVLSLTVILAALGSLAVMIHVKTQERQILDTMILGADQLSGSITSATWHAMLDDHRDAAYEIMQTIARKQGIRRIRIFNKEGKVMFSTVPGDDVQVDKDAEACSMCHSAGKPLVRVDMPSRSRVYTTPDGARNLAMITPIYNETACSSAACHAHPASQSVLGVLDVSFDLAPLNAQIAAVRQRVLLITLSIMIIIGIFVVAFTRRFVEVPIRQLIAATRAISGMDLDKPIRVNSSEEISALAKSFDAMRLRLREAHEEVESFTRGLETKVAERTVELKTAQTKLMQSARLASLGQLSATVAHEINNPLSGVLNLSMLLQRILTEEGIPAARVPEVRRYLEQIVSETGRVGRIVQDLLSFSRRSKPNRAPTDLNAIVNTTMSLVSHKLKLMEVSTGLDLDPSLPRVNCDASQMQQVLLNLVVNGAEAAQGRGGGMVCVSTSADAATSHVVLTVSDNGDGIPEDVLEKIFDPFFTTKGESKGTGLGLAVVYGIVQQHHGEIDVESHAGSGTRFTVRLPVTPPDSDEAPAAPAKGHG